MIAAGVMPMWPVRRATVAEPARCKPMLKSTGKFLGFVACWIVACSTGFAMTIGTSIGEKMAWLGFSGAFMMLLAGKCGLLCVKDCL